MTNQQPSHTRDQSQQAQEAIEQHKRQTPQGSHVTYQPPESSSDALGQYLRALPSTSPDSTIVAGYGGKVITIGDLAQAIGFERPKPDYDKRQVPGAVTSGSSSYLDSVSAYSETLQPVPGEHTPRTPGSQQFQDKPTLGQSHTDPKVTPPPQSPSATPEPSEEGAESASPPKSSTPPKSK